MCAVVAGLPKRILIIDDDLDLLMLLERRLDREGYAVETAASLPEAQEILPQFSPDLILLDINVNGNDGRRLCWDLKQQQGNSVAVLLMSGFDYSKSRAALFGADDLLPKPLNTDYLLFQVNQYLTVSSA